MYITITVKINQSAVDIRIDSQQTIAAGLHVLQMSGMLPKVECPDFFRSVLNEKIISVNRTFSEEGIYDGDILEAVISQ